MELDPASRGSHGPRSSELLEASTASVKQELLHLSLARQALEAEKVELTRLLEQREGVITELRKQMHQRDKAMHTQRAQFEDALRNVQNGKRVGVCGDSPSSRGGPREELHLVRDAIASLRSNFRETDPNQHTLDTLEQAISILIERSSTGTSGGGGGGSSSNDKNSRASDQRHQMNGVQDASTKVIYFTERTVTPFMSTINKPLGEIRLRDFKNMFDRPGLFRFHFKSYDPEYGMVKEEIVSDDDILPGVEGKIIAWVEEDVE
ncbi:Dixin-A [Portunus trituberculatus]|uniref:Dixin-A n=1 Tax=Portunus trituberculatus TaxID=210409 RepID=A0A5B7EUY4_PORTR|nr:Dixin-A [Portunus trituberculatus]